MTRAVVLHDPDGLNPYGRELAAILAESRKVTLVLARDAEWQPEFCRVLPFLPGNRGGRSKIVQGLSLVRGLGATAWRGAVLRQDVVVAWSRSVLEDLVFAILGWTGVRIAVVVHNPIPRTTASPLREWSTHLSWRKARWRVTHGAGLAADLLSQTGNPAVVCPHPPYPHWWAWASRGMSSEPSGAQCRLLVLGQMREDKGLSDLLAALSLVSPSDRSRLSVSLCGRVPTGTSIPDFSDLVDVDDRTSPTFISDKELAQALSDAQVLVAPLTMATQSGTVILALSAGLTVVTYDGGEVGSVVSEGGLVPCGDTAQFARKLGTLARGGSGGVALLDQAHWATMCRDDWSRLLDD